MNRKVAFLFTSFWPIVFVPLLAQTNATPPRSKVHKQATSSAVTDTARGAQVFEENCSRCHNAPLGFPPQISATILRHMRVRASLSAEDEKALLHFMNP